MQIMLAAVMYKHINCIKLYLMMSSKIRNLLTRNPLHGDTTTIKYYICGREGGGGGCVTLLTKSTIKASWILSTCRYLVYLTLDLSFLRWNVALLNFKRRFKGNLCQGLSHMTKINPVPSLPSGL